MHHSSGGQASAVHADHAGSIPVQCSTSSSTADAPHFVFVRVGQPSGMGESSIRKRVAEAERSSRHAASQARCKSAVIRYAAVCPALVVHSSTLIDLFKKPACRIPTEVCPPDHVPIHMLYEVVMALRIHRREQRNERRTRFERSEIIVARRIKFRVGQ